MTKSPPPCSQHSFNKVKVYRKGATEVCAAFPGSTAQEVRREHSKKPVLAQLTVKMMKSWT